MEGRRTALLQSVALVPVTPKSAKSSLDSPGNPGESRGSQGKRNRSSHYTSPSLELKSRGRPYQPTKEDHSITFASFSPHSKASLPVPPSLACLLASRLITRPPSLLLPTFFLSIRGSLPPLSLDNPIIRPFFSARKTFLFRRFKDNRARLEAIEHPLVEIRLYTLRVPSLVRFEFVPLRPFPTFIKQVTKGAKNRLANLLCEDRDCI